MAKQAPQGNSPASITEAARAFGELIGIVQTLRSYFGGGLNEYAIRGLINHRAIQHGVVVSEQDRKILVWRVHGRDVDYIATKLDKAPRTVINRSAIVAKALKFSGVDELIGWARGSLNAIGQIPDQAVNSPARKTPDA